MDSGGARHIGGAIVLALIIAVLVGVALGILGAALFVWLFL